MIRDPQRMRLWQKSYSELKGVHDAALSLGDWRLADLAKEIYMNRVRGEASKIRIQKLKEGCECFVCGCSIQKDIQIHHKTPVCEWGNNDSDNLIILCKNCHEAIHRYQCGIERLFRRNQKDFSRIGKEGTRRLTMISNKSFEQYLHELFEPKTPEDFEK